MRAVSPQFNLFLLLFFCWLSALPVAADPPVREVTVNQAAQQRMGLRTESVQIGSVGDSVRIVGQVTRSPGATTEVRSALAGQVTRVLVAPGDEVHRGQMLLELHSHELHDLEADLLRAAETLRRAERRLQAGRELLEVQGISRLEVEGREEEVNHARVSLMLAQAELHSLGLSDGEIDSIVRNQDLRIRYRVTAPAAGTVLELGVQPHTWVQNFEPLLTLGDPKRLELMLQVSPEQAARVAPGAEVTFRPVGQTGDRYLAHVLSRVPQVDAATRTVRVRAAIEGNSSATMLFPGVFVEGRLQLQVAQPAVVVPESAVVRMDAADFVFVRLGPTRFEARPLRLGTSEPGRYAVLEGLQAGEEIVVEGSFLLKSTLLTEAP